jgi:hypothetical protein
LPILATQQLALINHWWLYSNQIILWAIRKYTIYLDNLSKNRSWYVHLWMENKIFKLLPEQLLVAWKCLHIQFSISQSFWNLFIAITAKIAKVLHARVPFQGNNSLMEAKKSTLIKVVTKLNWTLFIDWNFYLIITFINKQTFCIFFKRNVNTYTYTDKYGENWRQFIPILNA